jgi:hypothetical protein
LGEERRLRVMRRLFGPERTEAVEVRDILKLKSFTICTTGQTTALIISRKRNWSDEQYVWEGIETQREFLLELRK